MVGEWRDTTLGDFLTLQRGFDLPQGDRVFGPYPVIASTGPVGTHSEAMVKGPGVVIGRSGSLGGGQYIRGDFWPLNTTLWVKDFNGNAPRFCYFLLKSIDFARFNAGSGVPTLNRNHIHPLPVRVPPLKEQQAIACILGTLDDKIELNRRMNRTLEETARAIFKSWFVDFDPVRAKAASHTPQCLKPEIAALFPDSFEDSRLGEIPKGWRVQSFTDGIDVMGGGTPKTSNPEYWGGNIPWFSVVDTPAPGEVFVIGTDKTITEQGVNNSSTRVLPVGTTIISARGTVGNLALAGVPMAMNQSCYGLCDRRGQYGYFLYYLTEAVVETLRQRTHGSVFNTITRDTLNGVLVVAPPDALVNSFEHVTEGMLRRILSALQESRTLAALRDTMLPKLTSGELRVPDAERIVGRAAC